MKKLMMSFNDKNITWTSSLQGKKDDSFSKRRQHRLNMFLPIH